MKLQMVKKLKYSRISLSRLPSISNISLSRTRSSVGPLNICGRSRQNSSLYLESLYLEYLSTLSRKKKYLVPRMRFQANFLSLSRTFQMKPEMNFLSSEFFFLNVTKWKNIQINTITLCFQVISSNYSYPSFLFT